MQSTAFLSKAARFCRTAALLTCAALTLANCGSKPAPIPREVNFKRYQPIMLNVGKIDFIEEYKSPMRDPNVDHLMPVTPTEAMKKWTDDRLRVAGMNKALQVIVKDASVIATPLPKPGGLQGVVSMGNDRKYDAILNVEMRIYGDGAMSEASIEVTATQSITISETATLNERDAMYRRMVFNLMETINAQLEKNMFQYFGNYIVF